MITPTKFIFDAADARGAHNTNNAHNYGFGASCANRSGFGASCDAPYGGCWLSQQQLRHMLDAEFNDGYDAGYQVAMNDARRGQAGSYAPSTDRPDDEPDEFDPLGVPAFSDRYDFGRSEEEFFNSPKEVCRTAAELFPLPKAAAEFFPLPEDDEPDVCGGGEESALMLLLKIAAEDEAEARSIIAELICEAGGEGWAVEAGGEGGRWNDAQS
jgi:hypothetical protein